MKELSLFSGAGGGLLATKHLLGWTTIGYVENEPYCQKVLLQRIKDGFLDAAPIFRDIRKFISEGYAEAYQGIADVITAGFPCQPFSVAGKQQGEADERNLWPATGDAIRIVRPRYALLENVPGLLAASHGYFGTILSGLAEVGYDARWTVLGANDVGGPHQRKRLWILAYSKCLRLATVCTKDNGTKRTRPNTSIRCKSGTISKVGQKNNAVSFGEWSIPPKPVRMVNELANQLDRLKAIGNGQVPAVAELAWKVLNPSTDRKQHP